MSHDIQSPACLRVAACNIYDAEVKSMLGFIGILN